MLDIKNCCLVVVDVQGKLAQLMHDKDDLFKNLRILIQAANILEIPIILSQQCPDALGATILEIAELLEGIEPVNKSAFSCLGEPQFKAKLDQVARKQVLLCGIETHICIYQTAVDLLKEGYDIHVIADAVSSRTFENKHLALSRIQAEGVKISSTEMALFELLRTADHDKFREIARLVK
jgi:nicotinamidase-related amidase